MGRRSQPNGWQVLLFRGISEDVETPLRGRWAGHHAIQAGSQHSRHCLLSGIVLSFLLYLGIISFSLFIFNSLTFTDTWDGKSALLIDAIWMITIAKRMHQLRWNHHPNSIQKRNKKNIPIITKMIYPVSTKSKRWMLPLLRTTLILEPSIEHQVTAISFRKIHSGAIFRPTLKISSRIPVLVVEKRTDQFNNEQQYHHRDLQFHNNAPQSRN